MRRVVLLVILLGCGLLLFPSAADKPPPTHLERVLKSGELRVVTRNAATTYYHGPEGPGGLEYELARGFAESLGAELRIVSAGNVAEVLGMVAAGEADFAAAGLTVTEQRRQRFLFTPPYQEVKQQLVYRLGSRRPKDLADLDGILEVVADSSHAERLADLKAEFPDLTWVENEALSSEELLTLVWERLIDYVVADSTELALNQPLYPELRVAFEIGEPQQLAWAFARGRDKSLYDAAVNYFEKLKQGDRLARLIERHYGHVEDFDYVGIRTFRRHIYSRLPEFRPLFEEAAGTVGLDWRMLAAMAYQESHWDPKAVSPTGVRGIMMLTQATAKYLGIKKRTDPEQSIHGGARYLRRLIETIPERIPDPDRTWLAMAAYNIGFGHLEDARILTQKRGGNPDSWADVKENLPLLRNSKWYKQTKHGYARGNEAARYVENIRSYYNILVWVTDDTPQPEDNPPPSLQIATPVL